MLPIYTLYLSPEQFGKYSFVITLNSFFILLITLSLEHGLGKFYYKIKDESGDTDSFFSTVFCTVLVSSVVIPCLILLVIFVAYSLQISDHDLMRSIAIGVFATAFYPAYSLYGKIFQVKKESKNYSKLSFSYTFFLTSINVLFIIVLGYKTEGLLLGLLITNVLFFIYSVNRFFNYYRLSFSFDILKDTFKYSLPLFPHSAASIISGTSDRMLIGYFLTMSSVGIYNVASQISNILNVLVMAFSLAYSPVFFEFINNNEKKKYLAEIAVIGVSLFSLVGLFLGVFSQEIVSVMATKDYIDAYSYSEVLVFVSVLQGVYIFTAGPLLVDSTKIYALVSIIASVINVILNIVLIPEFSVYGAVYATFVSKIFSVLLFTYFGWKSESRLPFDYIRVLGVPFIAFFLMLVTSKLVSGHDFVYSICLKLVVLSLFILFLTIMNFSKISVFYEYLFKSKKKINET